MKIDLFTKWLISIALSIFAVGLAWLGSVTSELLMWFGFGLLAVSLILSWTIRCPNCNRCLIGKRQFFLPRYCSHCGHKISEKESEE